MRTLVVGFDNFLLWVGVSRALEVQHATSLLLQLQANF